MRDRRVAMAAMCLALISAACVSPDDPSVAIEELQADIVFGVEIPEATPPPQADTTPPSPDALAGIPSLNAPFRNKLPERFRDIAFRVPTSDGACPAAPLGASPEEIAPDNATKPPAEGVYRWKREGMLTQTLLDGTELSQTISGFESRLVHNIESISDTEWTFEVAQPELGDPSQTKVTRYRVRTDAVERTVEPSTGGELLPVPVRTRVGEPDRGLTLERVRSVGEDGGVNSEFQPVPGPIYAQLPAHSGDQVVTGGVDARSGESIRHDATVIARQSVDACGTLVDGWLVESTQGYAGPDGSLDVEYDYVIATGLGGLIIAEEVHWTTTDELGQQLELDVRYTLGQLEPTPVAEAREGTS